jgi:hypothetical protein
MKENCGQFKVKKINDKSIHHKCSQTYLLQELMLNLIETI